MRTRAGKSAAAAAAAALLAGSLLAAPSVEITNVQQQYPWTNTVDITYTVQGVNKTHQTNRLDHIVNDTYFATFEAKNGNTPIQDVNGNTVFTNGLVQGNGTFTAQWQPKTDLQLTGCTMTPSVFRGEENAYLVMDLVPNKQGKCEYWYEPMSSQEASNKRYNTNEYKTKKMVFRKVSPGTYRIGHANASSYISGMGNTPHDVVVPAGTCYYIAIFPTTVAQFDVIMGAENPRLTNTVAIIGQFWKTLRANALAAADLIPDKENQSSALIRLAGLSGLPVDLPTEVMWEIAARANNTATYLSGNDPDWAYKYVWGNSVSNAQQVGGKLPNGWGLFDICNQWEWCRDTQVVSNLNSKKTDIYTPQSGQQDRSVDRGCARGYAPNVAHMNLSYRDTSFNGSNGSMGFRCAIIFK